MSWRLYKPEPIKPPHTYSIFSIEFSQGSSWQLSDDDSAHLVVIATSLSEAEAKIELWHSVATEHNRYVYIVLENTDALMVRFNASAQQWEKVC